MKKINLLLGTGIIFSVVIFFNSCQFSTAHIQSADLAKEVSGGNKEKISENTFHPNDGPFHFIVYVANAPSETKVKASWYAIDVEGEKNKLIDENEVVLQSSDNVDFNLSLPRQWPMGTYRVDLFLNDKLDRSVQFYVK
ncbi:MAG TPA: hypothetical protein PKK00_02150 [Bacteroidales bacterium]|nr:hypothetical protein [Bacteroidales bacterium]HPS15770.1 hypothetical protein [Bacteroidales bacterium]